MASSALLIPTFAIPFILSRGLTTNEYTVYVTAVSFLPVLNILPQAFRTGAAPRLRAHFTTERNLEAKGGFGVLVLAVIVGQAIAVGSVLLTFATLGVSHLTAQQSMALALVNLNALGLLALGLTAIPGSAALDFRPENFAKATPNLAIVLGYALAIYLFHQASALRMLAIFASAPWLIALALALVYRDEVLEVSRAMVHTTRAMVRWMATGALSIAWWNLTAYLATTASVTVVALYYPQEVVPFSIASGLIALAGTLPIAFSNPIVAHAAADRGKPLATKRRFFLRVQLGLLVYLAMFGIGIAVLPAHFFEFWVGELYASEVQSYAIALLPAYLIRLWNMPLTLWVNSYGKQEQLLFSPTLESVIAGGGAVFAAIYLNVDAIPLVLFAAGLMRLFLTVFRDRKILEGELELRPIDLILPGIGSAKGLA